MKNPNLTKWLEMVWIALAEPDQGRRDQQLIAASLLLREAGLVATGLVAPAPATPALVAADGDQERDAEVAPLNSDRMNIGPESRAVSVLELFEPNKSWSF